MSEESRHTPLILVVDDEPSICRMITDALRAGGMKVTAATSAADAVEAALAHKPDMVVTDLRLGDGSGLDVIDQVRDKLGDVPAVIITGHGDAKSLSEASRRRPVEVLNKPIDVGRLRTAIDGELDRQRKLSSTRNEAYETLTDTCNDLTATCRSLQGHLDRQDALIRYQTDLLVANTQDDVFRQLFRLFVERTGMVFGAIVTADDYAGFQLVGRFGVPIPDGVNLCRELAASVMPALDAEPQVTVIDATDNLDMFPEPLRRMLIGVTLMLVPFPNEDGELIGAAVLYRKGEQPFTDDDISLAEMVAVPTAAAVRRAA